MKRKHLLLFALALLICLILLACVVANAEPPANTEKIQNIKKLIDLQGGLGSMKGNIDATIAALREKGLKLPPQYLESMKKEIDDKFLNDLINRLVGVYDKHLTDEQVAEMLKFYDSPVGRQIVKAMPEITKEANQIAQECGQLCSGQVMDKLGGLTRAAAVGDTGKVLVLLGTGADVNESDAEGVTPLIVATYNGKAGTAKILVEKGADVNVKTRGGVTPLMAAVQSGNKELIRLLLHHGADANAKEQIGLNAYQLAVMKKQDALAALLKDKTTDKKPVRIGLIVQSTGKAKGCLPVMSLPSDSSKKITCLKVGQEILTIPGVAKNNGWTLIQHPAIGWVSSESINQTLVSSERTKVAKQERTVAGRRASDEDTAEPESSAPVKSPSSGGGPSSTPQRWFH